MLRYLILWSVVLLNSVSIVHAAAPAKPNLELKVQGLNIDVEWSVPGATGYRLFYVSQATPDKTEVVDMGSVTSISGRMEAGTAMSVMVQAYNEDGDSPLSDAKSFVITDPAATADPGAFQPEAQPLNFQAVFLDTPVAFVPTAEDTTKQRRSLRDRSAESGTEFSDGRIGMTVHIAPGLVYRNELELTLCLQIDEVCEPLLIYSNDKQTTIGEVPVESASAEIPVSPLTESTSAETTETTLTESTAIQATPVENVSTESASIAGRYADTIVISDLPTDVEKSVYLEILMPPELSDKLRGRAESKYTVYASDVRSQNPTAKHVAVAEIPVVDLGAEDERTRSSTRVADTNWAACTTSAAASGILCKTRSFGKNFSNSMFGIGFSVTPGLWLFSTSNAQNQTNRGVSIGADADITAKIFGRSLDDFATVRGALIKSSGKKVTRKLTLNAFGASVYSKNEYRNKTSGSTAASWNQCSGNSDANCSYEPEKANVAAKGGSDSESADRDDRMLDFYKETTKSYEKIFIVYIVPVTVEAGITGRVGVTVGATLTLGDVSGYEPAGGSENLNYKPTTVYYSSSSSVKNSACLMTVDMSIFFRGKGSGSASAARQRYYCIELPAGYGKVEVAKSAIFNDNPQRFDPYGWPLPGEQKSDDIRESIVIPNPFDSDLLKVELLRSGNVVGAFTLDDNCRGCNMEYVNNQSFDVMRITRMKKPAVPTLTFAATGGPYASLTAFARGGVTIFIASAGVGVDLTLLSNQLSLGVKAALTQNPSFSGSVSNTLTGPTGKLYLWASYYVPAFALPPWEKRTAELNIVSWSSFSRTFNIYEWSAVGSEQATQPSLANGSSDGQFIPEFTSTEPPADAKRWVCFYKGFTFDGERKCTKMPEGECGSYTQCKEIGFNLDVIGSGWDNAVRSIKVFGPLRLAMFREKDFGRGDSVYYYASDGEVEKIGGVAYSNGSTYILDSVASSVRMTTINTQTSYKPGLISSYFYQHGSRGGKYFSESTSSELKVSAMKAKNGESASWWNDEVSSVELGGVGTTCIYQDSSFSGFESCYASRGFWSTVNQGYMDDRTSSYALYSGTLYPLMLIQNSAGTIESAGTSSLPNGNITASGPLAGKWGIGYPEKYDNMVDNTADIAYVTGPATIFLYSKDNQKGRVVVFYLDAGEWDATYLIGETDDLMSMAVKTYKMNNYSWTEMRNLGLLPW